MTGTWLQILIHTLEFHFEEMARKYPGRRFYTMYHGTTVAAAYSIIKEGFRVSEDGMLGRGVYASRDMDKAAQFPINNTNQNVVLELSVKVGKVKKIDHQYHPLQLTWHEHGYDSAWVPTGCGMVRMEEDCIYDPNRIRVTNVVAAPLEHIDYLKALIAAKHNR